MNFTLTYKYFFIEKNENNILLNYLILMFLFGDLDICFLNNNKQFLILINRLLVGIMNLKNKLRL